MSWADRTLELAYAEGRIPWEELREDMRDPNWKGRTRRSACTSGLTATHYISEVSPASMFQQTEVACAEDDMLWVNLQESMEDLGLNDWIERPADYISTPSSSTVDSYNLTYHTNIQAPMPSDMRQHKVEYAEGNRSSMNSQSNVGDPKWNSRAERSADCCTARSTTHSSVSTHYTHQVHPTSSVIRQKKLAYAEDSTPRQNLYVGDRNRHGWSEQSADYQAACSTVDPSVLRHYAHQQPHGRARR